MEDDMDNNFSKPTTLDKIEQLQKLHQTPLQKFQPEVNNIAAAGNGSVQGGISKEILEFDKRFFTRQLERLAKSYQAELRNMQIKAREKAIEYVEKNMYVAKEALQNEMQLIMRQFDKAAMEKVEIMRDIKIQENRIMEQEKSIAVWKLLAMNGINPGIPPHYLDDPKDSTNGKSNGNESIQSIARVQKKVLAIRNLEDAQGDRFLSGVFNLYNATVRLNIDNKIELVERGVVSRVRKENESQIEQLKYLQNEIQEQMKMINSYSIKEEEMALRIQDLEEENRVLKHNAIKREALLKAEKTELVRKSQFEKNELLDQRRQL